MRNGKHSKILKEQRCLGIFFILQKGKHGREPLNFMAVFGQI